MCAEWGSAAGACLPAVLCLISPWQTLRFVTPLQSPSYSGGLRQLTPPPLLALCRWLRGLAGADSPVWVHHHMQLLGEPSSQAGTAALRRLCRRSELRAARWLEADTQVGVLT